MDATSEVNQIMMVSTLPVQSAPSSTGNHGSHKVKLPAAGTSIIKIRVPTFKQWTVLWGANILLGDPVAYCYKICGAEGQ